MTTRNFDAMYDRLVAAWERHEDAKRSLDISELFTARMALDQARVAIAEHRVAQRAA